MFGLHKESVPDTIAIDVGIPDVGAFVRNGQLRVVELQDSVHQNHHKSPRNKGQVFQWYTFQAS